MPGGDVEGVFARLAVGNADADREPAEAAMTAHDDLVDFRPDAFGDEVGARGRGVRQQQTELVAAGAREDVLFAQILVDYRNELLECVVTGGVAQTVVDALEVIDVDHDQRQFATVAGLARYLVAGEFVEGAQVVDTGQEIGRGEYFQTALERLAFGNVEYRADDAVGLPGEIAEDCLVEDNVMKTAVGVTDLRFIRLCSAPGEMLDIRPVVDACQIFGGDVKDGLADNFAGRKAEVFGERLVAGAVAPVAILDEDGDRQGINSCPQA